MTITTNTGKTFDVTFVGEMLMNERRLLIEYSDVRPLSAIASDFDGLETITKSDIDRPCNDEIYNGFNRLVEVHRNTAAGTVRLTLERSDTE